MSLKSNSTTDKQNREDGKRDFFNELVEKTYKLLIYLLHNLLDFILQQLRVPLYERHAGLEGGGGHGGGGGEAGGRGGGARGGEDDHVGDQDDAAGGEHGHDDGEDGVQLLRLLVIVVVPLGGAVSNILSTEMLPVLRQLV